jgi:hypothetical protein
MMNNYLIAFYAQLILANIWFAAGNNWFGCSWLGICVATLVTEVWQRKKAEKYIIYK